MLNRVHKLLIRRSHIHLCLVTTIAVCLSGPAVASAAPIDLGPFIPGDTGSSGPGSSGGGNESSGAWQSGDVSLNIAEGSVKTITLVWAPQGAPRGQLGAIISGTLKDVAVVEPGTAGENETVEFSLLVTLPAIAEPEYSGSVQITDSGSTTGLPLKVTVITNFGSGTTVPDDLASPSPERIISFEGTERIGDELLLTVEGDEQTSIVRRAAADTNAIIYGADQTNGIYQFRYRGKTPEDVEQLKQGVSQIPGVLDVSSNYIGYPQDLPNDPRDLPWSGPNDANWGLLEIDAPGAWDALGTATTQTKVGIIDVGPVFDRHEDLATPTARSLHVGTNSDFAKTDLRGSHPSHVAGIACAAGNNGKGITGAARDCDLRDYYLRGAATASEFTHLGYYLKAMNFAGKDKAQVVNMSVGFHPGTFKRPYRCPGGDNENDLTLTAATKSEIQTKMASVVRKYPDTLWVAAAGNACINVGNAFPAALAGHPDKLVADRVVAVAATTRSGGWASYSNYGTSVSLVAPGGQGTGNDVVVSTTPSCAKQRGVLACSSGYTTKAGTSQAAPYVTGTAAMAFSANSEASPEEVKRCLTAGAKLGNRWVARTNTEGSYLANARETITCITGDSGSDSCVQPPDGDLGLSMPPAKFGEYYDEVWRIPAFEGCLGGWGLTRDLSPVQYHNMSVEPVYENGDFGKVTGMRVYGTPTFEQTMTTARFLGIDEATARSGPVVVQGQHERNGELVEVDATVCWGVLNDNGTYPCAQ